MIDTSCSAYDRHCLKEEAHEVAETGRYTRWLEEQLVASRVRGKRLRELAGRLVVSPSDVTIEELEETLAER